MTSLILIGICTYNRNELLEKALKHIDNLRIPEQCELRVVISDNNPNKDAYSVYEKFKDFSFELYYVHEPVAGIAYARNAILQKGVEINADYIAFIDDDEFPTPDWIADLYEVMVESKADGSTSYPIQLIGDEEQPIPNHIKKRKRGSTRKICITNSVLFSADIVKKSNIWFDTSFGLMTGEDVDFFNRASGQGYKFVWDDKSLLYDIIPPNRLTMEFKLDRAFNNGYLKVFLARKEGKANFGKLLRKAIFDLALFSILYFITLFNKKLNELCLLKLMDCTGKIKSVYTEKPYTHYKRN